MQKLPTVEQVKIAAKESNFYVDSAGVFYRIQYRGDEDFNVYDKDTGEVTGISYEDAREGSFFQLVQYKY